MSKAPDRADADPLLQAVIEYQQIRLLETVVVDDVAMQFSVPNQKCLHFARALAAREPGTIAWIQSFDAADVFFDVGANVGIYSVFAALRASCRVAAFEPHFANYDLLVQNLLGNGLADETRAYCLALGARTEIGTLYLSGEAWPFGDDFHCHLAPHAGRSHNNFGAPRELPAAPGYRSHLPQGCVCFRLDDFVSQTGLQPTRLKIDVDGIELDVLQGAARTLASSQLRSVMVEVDSESRLAITATLRDAGFAPRPLDAFNILFERP